MTIADYLANQLFNSGVRYVYGIPGGPSIPYLEAFRKAGIEFILTSNEASAGIMADVTARLTGTPGVCHATFGPGATNLTTGVGGAFLDRSPVIALTSEIGSSMINRTTQMNIDHQKLYTPLTKGTWRLTAESATDIIDSALTLCKEEFPGPVHIGLPVGLAESIAGDKTQIPETEKIREFENDTETIIELLKRSKRPLIAAGLTAARTKCGGRLLSFLETCRIPVVLTPMAKGVLAEDHPCYAGVLFHSLSDALEEIYKSTDLVIGLGYDPVEYDYESWMPDVPLVHFSTVANDLPDNRSVNQFTGPSDEWFRILGNMSSESLLFDAESILSVRKEMESVFDGFTNHFGPVSALKVLQEIIPGDAIVTADVGSHLHLMGQYWRTRGSQNLHMTNGWSGMGFGIPAALAAQLLNPGKKVICVTGDGGFLMMAGEMITARRYNLPVIIVVFSDCELNLIRLKQAWQNLEPYGTKLYSGELFCADTFMGLQVLNADSEESMINAVITSLSCNAPVIINALIDPEDYKWLVVKR